MNAPRLICSILAILFCAAAIWSFHSQSSVAQVQRPPAQKQCVGIATAILRTENPVVTRVYRIFDDGAVETYDDGAPGAKWNAMGQ